MKLKIDWKTLGKQLWEAIKPVLAGAIGAGLISFNTGCSSLTPTAKTQSISVLGLGIPAIAVVTSSTQSATVEGGDTNTATQTNTHSNAIPVSVSADM